METHPAEPPPPPVVDNERIALSDLQDIFLRLLPVEAKKQQETPPPHWKTWVGPAKDIGGNGMETNSGKKQGRGKFRSASSDRVRDQDEICGCSPYEHAFKPNWECLGLFVGGGRDQGTTATAGNKGEKEAHSTPAAREVKREASAGDVLEKSAAEEEEVDSSFVSALDADPKDEEIAEDLQQMLALFDDDGALMVAPSPPPPPPPPEKLGWWDHGQKTGVEEHMEQQEAEDEDNDTQAENIAAARSRRREASWRGWVPLDA